MDHRSRNPDRADPLRQLSRAIARGAAQVLQQSVQVKPLQRAGEHQASQRRNSHSDDDPSQMNHCCESCGTQLPASSRPDRKYCCNACMYASLKPIIRAEQHAARAGRICQGCDGVIPLSVRRGAKYCCAACRSRAKYAAMKASLPKRSCKQCGATFQGVDATQSYCSIQCASLAKITVPPRPCDWCGQVFKPVNAKGRFCCTSCASKAKALARGCRVAVPLTAARFDAMFIAQGR